ncbi:hypothetical protein BN12_1150035 [Nostocoides japonicum T1-X7]|uniref:HTH marR-type domain-containing protein n=1 Tax=Nostocoides japonicum T1-X7 TaxID=1194083 RepID=A0A077LUE9_9MICO|nr:MarR family transcriptional regulator [Tetrasphaera japonica]CCH76242.1 hypothetical protein BN12_1150035 [Tetrasphaera japonica T1-X7]
MSAAKVVADRTVDAMPAESGVAPETSDATPVTGGDRQQEADGPGQEGGVTPEVADLAGRLRVEVNRLAYHLRRPATREGITPSRLAALYALRFQPDGIRQGDLASQLGLSPASMTRLVEILLDSGWASREVDQDDQRARLVSLTPEGIRLLDEVRCQGTQLLSEDLAALSESDRAAIASAVPVLRGLADRRLQSS